MTQPEYTPTMQDMKDDIARLNSVIDNAVDTLRPFSLALKSARHTLGKFPDQNDVAALALRRVGYEDLKAALGFYAIHSEEPKT